MERRQNTDSKGAAVFDDVSSSALRVAVNGLSARQQAIANNVANLETPGFSARRVEFENALNRAVSRGSAPSSVKPAMLNSLEPSGPNGNNVNLDTETLSHIDTTMRYELALRAWGTKYAMLRSAIKGV